MAVPSKAAMEEYAALMEAESSNRQSSSEMKAHFRRTIKGLRKVFTPKSTDHSGLRSPLASQESLSQDAPKQSASFQGGFKYTQMREATSRESKISGCDRPAETEERWSSTPKLMGPTLRSEDGILGGDEEVATPNDSGLNLVTPAMSPLDALAFSTRGSRAPIVSRRVRHVSQGTINYDNGDYIRFGSINNHQVATVHRAPSVRSQSAVSISNSELDEVESLAEAFPEIGEVVADGQDPKSQHETGPRIARGLHPEACAELRQRQSDSHSEADVDLSDSIAILNDLMLSRELCGCEVQGRYIHDCDSPKKR